MIDINIVRENPEAIKKDLKKRNLNDKIKLIEELRKKDAEWKNLKKQVDELRHMRNKLSKEISEAKKKKGNIAPLLKKASEMPKEIQEKEDYIKVLEAEINDALLNIPNILHDSVPFGESEKENALVKKFGKSPKFAFKPKSHINIMEALCIVDTERAAKISGARFWFMKNDLARLDLALQAYAVDFLAKKGYSLVQPPFMMNKKAYEGVTDLKDFEDVMYKIEREDLYLIATSEHPLIAMFMNEILEEKCFPVKMCGISPCFRKEAGTHGKDTKGIFRGHQFNKVEQIIICRPEESWKFHEELIRNTTNFFKSLGLHFRQVNVCRGDIGSVAAKKYDLEAWFPVQNAYREIASCSNCTDYQARRLRIRYRKAGQGTENAEKIVPHTLNSTCVATSRALAAIIENFQNKDGSVTIPKALQKYMNGQKRVAAKIKTKIKKAERKKSGKIKPKKSKKSN